MSDNVEIKIVMSRELFEAIRSNVLVRALSYGGLTGLADSFLGTFVQKVDEGASEWNVQRKK